MDKPRLHRLDEYYNKSPLIFVTFSTAQRKAFLNCGPIHESFQSFCLEAQRRHNLVGRYVLMPDHIHFFVQLHPAQDLSLWIKSLKNFLSKTLRAAGHAAPHWQKNFFDHVLRSEESYGSKWTYVQQNPVRAGLVLDAAQWPYQGEIVMLSYR